MERFLMKASLYVSIMLSFFVAIELLLMREENEYSYKKEYTEQHLDGIRVLILGHSHLAQGINPKILGDSCFNMAIHGRNYKYDVQIAQRYIPKMKNLKYVFMPFAYNGEYSTYKYKISSPSLNEKRKVNNYENTYRCMYYKYMGLSYNKATEFLHWSELLNSKLRFMNRFEREDSINRFCDTLGFYPFFTINIRPKDWAQECLPPIIDYSNPHLSDVVNDFIQGYRNIAKLCEENHVKFIIISTPVADSYKTEMTEQGLAEMKLVLDKIKEDLNIVYYNLLMDSRFSDNDFWDASHLNESGAQKLSEIVNSEIITPK